MLSVDTLIWISFRPLLRLTICTLTGFAITKADLFPSVAAKGAGNVTLNIAIPSLVFSNIVPAITPENIGSIGPIILVGILYQTTGMLMAYIVKQVFWVPHRFRYGILFAGAWGNFGDIPTSVILSLTGGAPFSGTSDQNLAVAYLSAFTLLNFITIFPLGGHKLIAMDFDGPDMDDIIHGPTSRKMSASAYLSRSALGRLKGRLMGTSSKVKPSDIEKNQEVAVPSVEFKIPVSAMKASDADESESRASSEDVSVVSQADSTNASSHELPARGICTSDIVRDKASQVHISSTVNQQDNTVHTAVTAASSPTPRNLLSIMHKGIRSFASPPTIAILVSFAIGLIKPVKALFIPVPNSSIPNAPDGQPPLAFIMDAATFVGGASVPLCLICLWSAIARLELPRGRWHMFPLGAMTSLTIGKMIFMPVLGVLIMKGLVSASIVSREDKVLQLVCIFFSCIPGSTNQVILTQVYSGTGHAEHPTAFLIPQYAVMFVSMTSLTAYTLSLLF